MIEIYTKLTWPYCINAKALLNQKDVTFIEHNIYANSALSKEMINRYSGYTPVPQIFINNQHISGCDDLYALAYVNKLNPLLGK